MIQDSETRTYTKPDLNAQFREQELPWEGKWANMWFSTDGRSSLGKSRYESQKSAADGMKKRISEWALPPGKAYIDHRDGHVGKYSHTIQIPVKS